MNNYSSHNIPRQNETNKACYVTELEKRVQNYFYSNITKMVVENNSETTADRYRVSSITLTLRIQRNQTIND